MEIFKQVGAYIAAVFNHWIALLGGGIVIVGIGQYERFLGRNISPALYWLLSFALLIIAGFLAWRDQHKKAREAEQQLYDGRPLFVLEVFRPADWKGHTTIDWSFRLTNCGSRTARWVKPESILSYQNNFELRFFTIPALAPGSHEHLGYEVSPKGSMDKRTLAEFLDDYKHTDGMDQMALGWWDVTINFRDTDEHVGKEIIRLCYDVQKNALFGTSVPYTERPSKQLDKS